jgi:hypothetical protein
MDMIIENYNQAFLINTYISCEKLLLPPYRNIEGNFISVSIKLVQAFSGFYKLIFVLFQDQCLLFLLKNNIIDSLRRPFI